MSKRPDRNMIVGLDIGTSKVVAIVGEANEDGSIEVVGIGSHPSRGLKKGCRREHRVHGALDSARRRGSRAHGRLRHPLGVHRYRRQPRSQPEFSRHRRDS